MKEPEREGRGSHPLWSAWNGAPFAAILALGGAYVALRRWMFTRAR